VGAGTTLSARIAGGASHTYLIAVPAGRLLHLVVDQQGVDVILVLRRAGEPPRLAVDSPNRDWGPEELWWIAPDGGLWQLEIRPLRPDALGTYRLRVLSIGLPSKGDRLRVAAQAQTARAEELGTAGDARAVRTELLKACQLWRRAGEPGQEALADLRLAEAEAAAHEDAAPAYRRALDGFHRLGDVRQETYANLRLGEALRQAGDLEGARGAQEAALALARRGGFLEDEAAVLNNLGLLLEARGELRAALEHYRLALAAFRRLGDQESVATALQNLGVGSSLLGSLDAAERDFGEALALRRGLGNVRGEAATLTELGWVYRLRALTGGGSGVREQARIILEQALERRRAARDSVGEAGTLDRLGTVLREAGRWDEALACYQQSLALVLHDPPGRDVAHSLTNLAELWLDRGDPARARRLAARAVARFVALAARDPQGEAHARFLLGRAAAGLGDSAGAERELGRSIDTIEALRASLGDEILTLPFFALRQLYFEGAIDALMHLDGRQPGRGFAADALLASERSRMRTLVDGIAERERRNRGAGAAEDGPPLTVDRIAAGLLDRETLLLEFSLGEERGYLWVVSHDGLASYRLPGRRALEPLVRQVYQGMAGSRADPAACLRLAGLLLGPLGSPEDRREIRRLVLVTDGLLAYVPFAALPWSAAGHPLAERFEIVRLPSATTLLALRGREAAAAARGRAGGSPAGPPVAVLADPVFSAFDRRVRRGDKETGPVVGEPADRPDLTRAARDLRLDDLPRLPATRREAAAIAALAPGSFVALDFAAGRETFASDPVRHARLLHLATHSLAHPSDPALSGIVLSLVDDRGRPRLGFLRTGEIAGLDLRSRLVVLSACRTALGPEVRGEGLLGLSRAFLHAGASQVVASLWSVEDNASAAFMARFYEALLRDHLTAAAALRRAQLALRADPRTADPACWAGFELEGDWR